MPVITILFLFLASTGMGVLVVWCIRQESKSFLQKRKRVKEKYATLLPVTDEAFIAACSPGVNPEVALRVRDTLVDTFGVSPENIHPDMELLDLELF
jgi:hypothetical protein